MLSYGGMSLGLRLLTGEGLTANPGNLGPDVGMKWKILYVQVALTAGSGTGNRQITVLYSPYNQGPTGSPSMGLCLACSGTGTGTLTQQGGPITSGSSGITPWNDYPILEHTGVITFNNTLISGDSFNYTILVDEEADF